MAGDATHEDPTALHTHAPGDAPPRLPRSTRFRDAGLLMMRLGLGAMFVGHGLPKIVGGPAHWTQLGEAVRVLGIHFGPSVVWGFLAALSEFGGGILLAAGVFFRPACLALFATMSVATLSHMSHGDDFATTSHPAELAVVFFSLLWIGAGPWRVRLKH
jgi:putative oxidoreductase